METKCSLPNSQMPATCHYPEPARSSPYPHNPTSWRSISILSSHLRLRLPSGLFPSCFRTKTLYTRLISPIRATHTSHLILLDLFAGTILGEQYRSLSSSLCSFLHSPVTSSLLCPNILLSIHSQTKFLHQCTKTRSKIIFLCIFFVVQCHHTSLWTSWSSLLGMAAVQPTSEFGTPMRRSYVVRTMWVVI